MSQEMSMAMQAEGDGKGERAGTLPTLIRHTWTCDGCPVTGTVDHTAGFTTEEVAAIAAGMHNEDPQGARCRPPKIKLNAGEQIQ